MDTDTKLTNLIRAFQALVIESGASDAQVKHCVQRIKEIMLSDEIEQLVPRNSATKNRDPYKPTSYSPQYRQWYYQNVQKPRKVQKMAPIRGDKLCKWCGRWSFTEYHSKCLELKEQSVIKR